MVTPRTGASVPVPRRVLEARTVPPLARPSSDDFGTPLPTSSARCTVPHIVPPERVETVGLASKLLVLSDAMAAVPAGPVPARRAGPRVAVRGRRDRPDP